MSERKAVKYHARLVAMLRDRTCDGGPQRCPNCERDEFGCEQARIFLAELDADKG